MSEDLRTKGVIEVRSTLVDIVGIMYNCISRSE